MNKSVLEILEQVLTGHPEIVETIPQNMTVTTFDRVLGKLRSPIVPKLVYVVHYFGINASRLNKSPAIGLGVDAVLKLITSELVVEYGTQVRPDEQISVRWDPTQGWLVVAVSHQAIRPFVASPSAN